jgi:hypothetical protein
VDVRVRDEEADETQLEVTYDLTALTDSAAALRAER